MKRNKLFLGVTAFAAAALIFVSADHIDAPAVTSSGASTAADITDFYAFQGANTSNMVFVVNTQGLLSPGATTGAKFNNNNLFEINIDNNGDNVEDLVIQAVPRNGKMYFFGPAAPAATGTSSTILTSKALGSVDISSGATATTATSNGISMFAGPRDDPFFFDFTQFNKILAGTATGFLPTGVDTFKGTNVMSIVVEVPKALLGNAASLNAWSESKVKN